MDATARDEKASVMRPYFFNNFPQPRNVPTPMIFPHSNSNLEYSNLICAGNFCGSGKSSTYEILYYNKLWTHDNLFHAVAAIASKLYIGERNTSDPKLSQWKTSSQSILLKTLMQHV